MCPGHQGLEYGMETIGTSASGPQPTAAHLSSPTLTHRDQGSAPFPASLTPPFPPQSFSMTAINIFVLKTDFPYNKGKIYIFLIYFH